MEIIITTGAIAAIKVAANNAVPSIEKEYHELCNTAQYGFWQWLGTRMTIPPSLRFYNEREQFLRGQGAARAEQLRELWHAIWHINDSCSYCEGQVTDATVQLSAYTTRQLLLITKLLGITVGSKDQVH